MGDKARGFIGMASVAHIIRRRRSRKARRGKVQARSRRWTLLILTIVFLVVVVPAGVTLGGAAWVYWDAVSHLPTPNESAALGPVIGPTQLYDRTGETLLFTATYATEGDENWVSLDELPSYVLQATLLMEDPDFLTATSFDPFNTFGRMWRNILYGPLVPDTSLTARLVRNVIAPLPELPNVDDIGREIARVAEIERRYTPQQILEWHLNTNYYGGEAYGIQAAAQIYLGKDAVDLTLDEAALLSAIPLAPQYNPFDNEPAARGRQLDVLKAMRAAGNITSDQFDIAATTLTPIQIGDTDGGQIAPEFAVYARRQAEDILVAQGRDGAQLVSRGGLRIVTTLDLDLYYQSECAIQTYLARLNGTPPPETAADGQPCQTALYLPLETTPLAEGAPDQARLVLIDATTGEIKTMIGPATAVNAQPGVTLFPFVYLTGFMRGQNDTPAKMVLDVPRTFPGAQEGLIYTPTNPDGRFRGVLNLRDAMSAWLLPPAAQIARERGLDEVLRFAHRVGLNSLGEDGYYDLSLLERGGAVSVLDMAYAYSVFAAQGEMRGIPGRSIGQWYRQLNPVAVLRIEDADGNLLWSLEGQGTQFPVFPHEVGYLVNDILADTEKRRGLLGDTSILELPRRTAVVNGMVGGDTESWTVGYTPQVVVGVHMERADGSALAIDPLGLQGAAPVWRAVMQYAHERDGIPADDWPRPEGILTIAVCEKSGLLPNDVCPVRNEIFIAVRPPTQTDTYWRSVEINNQTFQLATASTPAGLRSSTLYFIPPPEAMDWWVANNQPLPPEDYDNISRPNLLSTVQILQPAQFAYVGGQVDIRGSLDPVDMQYFQLSYGQGPNPTEWFQIGERQTEFRPGSTLGTWDTTGLSDGLYILRLSLQHNDNTAENGTIQVTVDNTPPTVTLTAGEPGRIYTLPNDQVISLVADVQDTYTVSRVEFYQDGQFLGSDTEYPFGFNWNINQTGTTTFSAVAFDRVGNQASSEITVEITRGG
jgi:membrane peptidoglycan carboxypeptidase